MARQQKKEVTVTYKPSPSWPYNNGGNSVTEEATQNQLPLKTSTYVCVIGTNVSMSQTLPAWGYTETDPHDLIKHWIKDGGIFLPNKFIPWRLITEVTWSY